MDENELRITASVTKAIALMYVRNTVLEDIRGGGGGGSGGKLCRGVLGCSGNRCQRPADSLVRGSAYRAK